MQKYKKNSISSTILIFFLKKRLNYLEIQKIIVTLQQIIKAPPFFLEWTWPSEGGFFYEINFSYIWHSV